MDHAEAVLDQHSLDEITRRKVAGEPVVLRVELAKPSESWQGAVINPMERSSGAETFIAHVAG